MTSSEDIEMMIILGFVVPAIHLGILTFLVWTLT